jgi:predicted amidohydrolase
VSISETITVAALQLAAHDLADAEQALQRALHMIDEAAESRPDLMVLPECTYPAYYLQSLEAYAQAPLRPHEEVVALFAGRARYHGCHLVAGLVRPAPSGRLLNAAYLFSPDGDVVGQTAKSFLWHFDQYWFDAGEKYPAFDLPFGRTGIFVCADGRMPEVVRSLGVQQARLLVDTTAWVSTGGDWSTLSNPQFEYMMPVRAIENGAWIVVANKVGIEAESIVYCGRSCVLSPAGEVVAQGSTDREEIVTATIYLSQAGGPPVPRRPACYEPLAAVTSSLPVSRQLAEAVIPAETVTRVGLLQLQGYDDLSTWLERVSSLAATLVHQEAELIVLPGVPAGRRASLVYEAETMLPRLQALSRELGCGLVCPLIRETAAGERRSSAYLLVEGDVRGRYDQVHLAGRAAGAFVAGDEIAVWDTPYGRLGIMLDEEGLVPEMARTLMLKGAEVIVWPARSMDVPLRTIARCRADENKLFVALATPLEAGSRAQTALLSPTGAFIAAALPDIEQGIAGQVATVLARLKEMAPNTDVVHNRQPANYSLLVQ